MSRIELAMRFDIITIFPEAFDSYLNVSMMKRVKAKKIADIRVHNLRKFARDKHRKVDDSPYGGGPGMVLRVEPIIQAINSSLRIGNNESGIREKKLIILFSAAGKQFNAKMAADFAKKYDRIIMICGHYEGFDDRIRRVIRNWKLEIIELSIGPYVLTGGELPALVVTDAVLRHIPGFLGKAESLEEKRYGIGVPTYTRPEIFTYKSEKYKVPKVLLSGDHKKIEAWRKKYAKNE